MKIASPAVYPEQQQASSRAPEVFQMHDEPTFSAAEAVAVQEALRRSLALEPERFPVPAFVGMISDEIEQLREAGRTDADIVGIIKQTIGRDLSVADVERFYASPQARGVRATSAGESPD